MQSSCAWLRKDSYAALHSRFGGTKKCRFAQANGHTKIKYCRLPYLY